MDTFTCRHCGGLLLSERLDSCGCSAAAKEQADASRSAAACSRSSGAEKYAEPHGSKERVEEQLRIALDGHPNSELWGEHGLIAATMLCVNGYEKMECALRAMRDHYAQWSIPADLYRQVENAISSENADLSDRHE